MISHHVFPLNAGRLLSGKLPAAPLAPLLDAALKLRRFTTSRTPAGVLAIDAIERFGPEHDALWEAASQQIECAVVRDASYLNWKYVDRPGGSYHRLGIRLNAELVATAVIVLHEPDDAYRYRRAVLVDCVLAPGDRRAARAMLEAIRGHCEALGADAIHAYVMCEPLQKELKRFGFIEREATRHLLVTVNGINDALARVVTNREGWFCTMGDSDADNATFLPAGLRRAPPAPVSA
jgi:hypothetical protein